MSHATRHRHGATTCAAPAIPLCKDNRLRACPGTLIPLSLPAQTLGFNVTRMYMGTQAEHNGRLQV
jgi:hypothetical protein